MIKLFARLVRDEKGAAAIEYALIAAVVGLGIVGALTTLGTNLSSTFTNVGNAL